MRYAFFTIFRQPGRYIPAILTVGTIGALLIAQVSLLASAIKYVTLPIETAAADIWIGRTNPSSFESPQPMPRQWESRVSSQTGVSRSELYLIGLTQLKKQDGTTQSCVAVGSTMTNESIGAMSLIPAEMRHRLSNRGAFACYESDMPKLRLQLNEQCEIADQSAYFVGTVPGKQYTVPYLICSIETAEKVIPGMNPSRTSYVVAQCDPPELAASIASGIERQFPDLAAYSREKMCAMIRDFIIRDSRTGLVIISVTVFCVAIAIFVTSQTLYSVTVSLKNEIAVLDALGISLGKLSGFVLWQSLIISLIAAPIAVAMALLATTLMSQAGLPVDIEPTVYPIAAILAGVTSIISAWIALRSLRHIEPAELLH